MDDRNWSFNHKSGESNDIIEKHTFDAWIPDLESESPKNLNYCKFIVYFYSSSLFAIYCSQPTGIWIKPLFLNIFFPTFFLLYNIPFGTVHPCVCLVTLFLFFCLICFLQMFNALWFQFSWIFKDIKSSRIRWKECVEKKLKNIWLWFILNLLWSNRDFDEEIVTRNNQKKKYSSRLHTHMCAQATKSTKCLLFEVSSNYFHERQWKIIGEQNISKQAASIPELIPNNSNHGISKKENCLLIFLYSVKLCQRAWLPKVM